MGWDERFFALFDDLEQQAEGLALEERDLEVAERARAEYAAVDLVARLHGSLGAELTVRVDGIGLFRARLARVGADFVVLDATSQLWVVPTGALLGITGLTLRATGEAARPITARLGLRSVLRGMAEAGDEVTVHRRGTDPVSGRIGRVGADFVEVGDEVLPLAAIAGVRSDYSAG